MKKVFFATCALLLMTQVAAANLTKIWSVKAGATEVATWFPWQESPTLDNVRGAAYNAATDHVLIASRAEMKVKILDAADGSVLGNLADPSDAYVSGSAHGLAVVTATESGVIIASGLDVAGASYTFYVWENEADATPELFTVAGATTRFGDEITSSEDSAGNITVLGTPGIVSDTAPIAKLYYEAATSTWSTSLITATPQNAGSTEFPYYSRFLSCFVNEDGSFYTKNETAKVQNYAADGSFVSQGTMTYGTIDPTIMSNYCNGYVAAANITYTEEAIAGVYAPLATDSFMWVWDDAGNIAASLPTYDLMDKANGNYAGQMQMFTKNDEMYVLSLATNNYIGLFKLEDETTQPSIPLTWNGVSEGYFKTNTELGFSDSSALTYINDVAYNAGEDSLLILEGALYGSSTDGAGTGATEWNEKVDPADSHSIQVVNRADGSVVKSMTDLPFFSGWGGPDPGRIDVSEDGVILIEGYGANVFKVGSQEVTKLSSINEVIANGNYYADGDDVVYGGSYALDVIGNYNKGECTVLTSRGNRIYVFQNSPAGVDQFTRVAKFTAYGDSESSAPIIRGVVASQDLSQIFTYSVNADGGALKKFVGSPASGYAQDTNYVSQFQWESSLDGDIEGGMIVYGAGHTDAVPSYINMMFQDTTVGSSLFGGNVDGSAYFKFDDKAMDNAHGGVCVDKVNGQVFIACSAGLLQMTGDTDQISSATSWSMFE